MTIGWTLPGKVFLVGAGPGSVKLLTVRAMEALESADTVFHDELVSAEVLGAIPSRTAVSNVGKRCGVKKIAQEEINRRMIAAARKGQTVVRLKSGDPLIFGRTREEIEALREAKVEFEIVPGITAATAAAAVAEIPLTDRKDASKLILASNHSCESRAKRDWHKSVTGDSTLVFYMPGSDFAPLSAELASSGLSEDTPCLLVSQATQPGQKLARTSLGALARLATLPAPSVLIIGALAAQARKAAWETALELEIVAKPVEKDEAAGDLSEFESNEFAAN